MEQAIFGGGCFWCIEAALGRFKGVSRAVSGYCGGHIPNPNYRQVCEGDSGHVEVVRVDFDPAVLSYETLLQAFFALHDPTTVDRQGNDVGPQYASVIFYLNDAQRLAASRHIQALSESGTHAAPIVTRLEPAPVFYPAEDYHQQYFALHGHEPYCQAVVAPKLRKFSQQFASLLS
ncbi:peptide-methionine (S)-S-oxide reductase [Xenophilus sp. AP218F]|nr:peptide-methionine (S)-S-oxide reductase [Xenophilus sp. AP218F]